MDKLSKAIKKLSKKQAIKIAEAIKKLLKDETKDLDVKKLRGFQDIFRVKIGRQRIIFKKNDKKIVILSISCRDDNTYRDY